jgi:hypothetical protein
MLLLTNLYHEYAHLFGRYAHAGGDTPGTLGERGWTIGVDVGCRDRSIEEDTEVWLPHGTGIWIRQTEASEVDNISQKSDGLRSRGSAVSIMKDKGSGCSVNHLK